MKVLFLSDLHLGADYISDHRAHELSACRFLSEKGKDADHIFLLGDVLDYWFEYREVVPKGFIRFFGTLAQLADSGVKITWLTGNHDIWLFGYLRDELGVDIVDRPYYRTEIGGKSFILAHGDRVGRPDFSFRLISSLFRNAVCQKLFSAVHPRWTVPFAHKWSRSSRYSHELTEPHRHAVVEKIITDAEILITNTGLCDYLIMGHHHFEIDERIADRQCRLIVLGDWINKFSYAEFDGDTVTLNRYYTGIKSFEK